ncbi:HlyD family efflux transporter periplasmic adaptor subunit [Ruminococcus sp. NK3A76]|uniref:HlyD family efflux transporter periplasmic adaptor subunit n=1 Tax=Ruminococcus sp. NK3A76 TaxID=877411 RepID=UPI0005626554|nr:HlyD family efflux transporter periplasmic adaptor subunit [Ruminococcus sp. NK3A76]
MRSSATIKVMTVLLSLFVVVMVAYQVYYHFNEKRDTVEAELYTYNDNVTARGVFVRDENVITYSGDGVLEYNYADASKVSVGSTVANVYASEEDILNVNRIEQLENRIAELERAEQPGTTDYIQPESLKSQIDAKYKLLISASIDNDFDTVKKYESEISQIMSIYNLVTNATDSYDSVIASLKKELKDLKKSVKKPKEKIDASETGYFVSYADGYEAILNKEKCVNLNKQQIVDIIEGNDSVAKPPNSAGKLLKDYSCKILMVIDNDERVVSGIELKAMLSASKETYNVYVESVKDAGDGQSIVILTCDSLDSALVSERVQRIELVFDDYTGLKVPREAIRFNSKKEKGVYVILGQDVQFKKIDIVYEGEDYVLSKNTSNEDYLLLYDQILLEAVKNGNSE